MNTESTKDRNARKNRAIERHVVRKAKRRVRSKKGFFWHLAVFCLVNAGLIAINLTHTPNYLWFLWALAAWSVGLMLHGISTFFGSGVTSEMVAAEIQREKERRGMIPASAQENDAP